RPRGPQSRRDVPARGDRSAVRAQAEGVRAREPMMKWFATFVLTALLMTSVQAQPYPSRSITFVVTAAAGGVTDVVARALAQKFSESWGQQVIVENKGGAAHVTGGLAVAKAAPDGYTLMIAEAGLFTINPTLYGKGKIPFDEERDFVPISGLVRINQ